MLKGSALVVVLSQASWKPKQSSIIRTLKLVFVAYYWCIGGKKNEGWICLIINLSEMWKPDDLLTSIKVFSFFKGKNNYAWGYNLIIKIEELQKNSTSLLCKCVCLKIKTLFGKAWNPMKVTTGLMFLKILNFQIP